MSPKANFRGMRFSDLKGDNLFFGHSDIINSNDLVFGHGINGNKGKRGNNKCFHASEYKRVLAPKCLKNSLAVILTEMDKK